MKRKLRVIVDTNVVISGIISKSSYPAKIIDAWLEGKFVPVICKILQEEINEVIRRSKIRKQKLGDPKDIKRILGILFNKSEKIKIRKVELEIDIDEKDKFLFELALCSKAEVLVSGDEEILRTSFSKIILLSPKDFCARYL